MSGIVMIECVSLPNSNNHLLEPFKIGEKAIYVGEVENPNQPKSFNEQFIRLKRIKTKSIYTESRKHFRFLNKKE